MKISIRSVTEKDFTEWCGLWEKYLIFYKTHLSEEIYKNTFKKLIDINVKSQNAFVAEVNNKLIGLAHYIYHNDNWKLEDSTYLQDLYTVPDFRGQGVGRQLIEAVYQAADDNNSPAVYWQTEKSNKTARVLYDKIARLAPFIIYER
jgi:GNAT superfamily N-acetyltransferase